MTRLQSPSLGSLLAERAQIVAWLARAFDGKFTLENTRTSSAKSRSGSPRTRSCPALPPGSRIGRMLWRDAIDELRRRHGRGLRRGWERVAPAAPLQSTPLATRVMGIG